MEKIELGDLTASLDPGAGGALRVLLTGRSASREAGKTLTPLFDRLIAEARAGSGELALHFEALEYFNSSTIAAVVQFIRAAQDRDVALTIVYDGKQRWQAMSFDALRRALRPVEAGGGPAVRFSDAGSASRREL